MDGATGAGPALGVLVTLAVIALLARILHRAFRRRIGGAGGGSEKAIVPVLWLLAAIATGILFATSR